MLSRYCAPFILFWFSTIHIIFFRRFKLFTFFSHLLALLFSRHFAKGPFAISFEFLFIVWRFWRLIAISAIFANACISGHISNLFCSKWHNFRLWRDSRVISSNQKSVFTQLATTWFVARQVWTWVSKTRNIAFQLVLLQCFPLLTWDARERF